MKAVNSIIECLEHTPIVLENLLRQIPEGLFGKRRLADKWSIHEQVCHLVDAQQILINRFMQFQKEENPLIKTYNPPEGRSTNYYAELDMKAELDRFPSIRKKMVNMLKGFESSFWEKQGQHEAFDPYNTQILLTHTLHVDYAHLFSIEQLGLTKDKFVNEILTIP